MSISSLKTSIARSVILCMALAAVASAAQAQTVTVDNSDSEFTILYGSWNSGAYGQPNGVDYNWTETTSIGGGAAAAEWRPSIPQAGVYNVAIWYVQGTNRANDATFTINHTGGATPVSVNQQTNGETWLTLGSFNFNAGTGGYVTLDNDANPSVVIADAVRFTAENTTVDLTMNASPPSWGDTTPTPGGPYTYYLNELAPISATPTPGYEFHHWTVSGGAPVTSQSSSSTTVLMDQSKTATAVFVEESFVDPEFRGFWADAFHVGYKSTSEIDDMISRALTGNYNAIVPEVLAYHDQSSTNGGHGAYWNSSIVPKALDIQGGIDPLAYLVAQAHANGLEVHPWLVTYRASTVWPPAGNATLTAHPEWIMTPQGDMGGGVATVSGKYTLDPGSPDVQEYLISIVRELVMNYEIDGIHWDYIRYTDTDAGYPSDTSYDDSGLARFKDITGYSGTPSTSYGPWSDFRRQEITELIRRAQVEMATIDSNPRQPLRHSAALITWGNAPTSFESTNSWILFQNWRKWMEEGHLDAGIPMTYYDYDTYPTWFENWVNQALVWRYDRHIFTGPGIYLNDLADSVYEISYAQAAGADGICTYSYAGTSSTGAGWSWYAHAASTVFPEPAPIPEMPWRDPNVATLGAVYGRVTDGSTGQPIDDATIRVNGAVAVQTDGNGFFVVTNLAAAQSGTPIALRASYSGYADVERPAVLVTRAGYTEANLALGGWLTGDYDVDGDVDSADFGQLVPAITGPDNGPPPAGGDLFDFDLDDDVDMTDFATIQQSTNG